MRALIPVLLILASCATPAPAPTPEKQPSAFDETITLHLQRATILEAFDQIARLSRLSVLMGNDLGDGTVTMSVNNRPAGELLEAVAATFGLKVTRLEPPNMVRVSKP